MNAVLASTYSKLRRAELHIDNLADAVRGWVAEKPWTVSSTKIYPASIEIWTFVVPLPDGNSMFEEMVADAIHNLRAPLDKMLTAYMTSTNEGLPGARFPGIAFPARIDQKAFEQALKALKKKQLPAKALEFLSGIEPYVSGKDECIYLLHSLDVEDKHYPSVMPINIANATTKAEEVKVTGGRVFTLGARRGHHLVAEHPLGVGPNHLIQPDYRLKPTYQENNGRGYLDMPCPPDEFEFMTTTIGAHFAGNVWPSPSLGLLSPDGDHLGPVEELLRAYLIKVRQIVEAFEGSVFPQVR
jgi:hypothetical protein